MKTKELKMKLLSPFLLLVVLGFTSCNPPALQLPYENEIYFEYENLVTGETGVIDYYDLSNNSMFSYPIIEDDESGMRRQQFYSTFYQDTVFSQVPQQGPVHVLLAFWPAMDTTAIHPIGGQDYGQRYTYNDLEDYLNISFPLGSLENSTTPFGFSFRYAPFWTEVSHEIFLNDPNAQLTITRRELFTPITGQPNLYVEGNFNCTSKILDYVTDDPLDGQDIFQITNGRFKFFLPVDESL